MRNNMWKKGLIIGIILLLFGTGITPGSTIENDGCFQNQYRSSNDSGNITFVWDTSAIESIRFDGKEYHNGTTVEAPFGKYTLSIGTVSEIYLFDDWVYEGNIIIENTSQSETYLIVYGDGVVTPNVYLNATIFIKNLQEYHWF